MGFRNGAYATVWSSEPGKGNFFKVRLSISRKMPDGNYEQDFSGFCTFVGQANAKASQLHERDRIRLGDVDVSTKYVKETNREYVNYKVFDYEALDNGNTAPAHTVTENPVESNPVEDDDQLPF